MCYLQGTKKHNLLQFPSLRFLYGASLANIPSDSITRIARECVGSHVSICWDGTETYVALSSVSSKQWYHKRVIGLANISSVVPWYVCVCVGGGGGGGGG